MHRGCSVTNRDISDGTAKARRVFAAARSRRSACVAFVAGRAAQPGV